MRWIKMGAVVVFISWVLGCSGGNPILQSNALTGETASESSPQTHLWGYYDVFLDIPSQAATATLDRSMMFAANVVTFLNNDYANLQFQIIDTPMDPDGEFVDVDIDVKIQHPFPEQHEYDGYDVRGIFIVDASLNLKYGAPDLIYGGFWGLNAVMYDYDLTADDIYPDFSGMPDGYTRWWNPREFPKEGIFGYTPGNMATPGYEGIATMNPYKYYADDLTPDASAASFLRTTNKRGVFSAGAVNVRNYYLRFPLPSPGAKFAYAIVANWKGENPSDHPANAEEAVTASVTVTPDIWYVDSDHNGGKLMLTFDLCGWGPQPSAIFVEGTVLWDLYQLTGTEMEPVGGGSSYSTYHVEIPADFVHQADKNEFWIIAEYSAFDYNYGNLYGAWNLTKNAPLAAFFRYDLFVSDKPY